MQSAEAVTFRPEAPAASAGAAASRSLHDLTIMELAEVLEGEGIKRAHARPLWSALQREGFADLAEVARCAVFLPPVRAWAARHAGAGTWKLDAPPAAEVIRSSDGLTTKFLLALEDGQRIETVVMGYPGRFTACVSTQAGCAMGCVFCATGQMGFVRNLRPGEIIAQVIHARRHLAERGERLRNLVLMGMGEPLQNFDAVMKALESITDTRGIGIGPSRISISTVGVVPGILRLAEHPQPFHLAVSLHGADEAERAALVPVSRRWPLADVIEACRAYQRITQRRIFFAWTLISGKNDSADHARRLAALLAGLDAHVNLIPLNRTDGYSGEECGAEAENEFQRILRDAGIPSTLRQRRGIDVAAGCGQLRSAKRSRFTIPAPTAP